MNHVTASRAARTATLVQNRGTSSGPASAKSTILNIPSSAAHVDSVGYDDATNAARAL